MFSKDVHFRYSVIRIKLLSRNPAVGGSLMNNTRVCASPPEPVSSSLALHRLDEDWRTRIQSLTVVKRNAAVQLHPSSTPWT